MQASKQVDGKELQQSILEKKADVLLVYIVTRYCYFVQLWLL